MDYIQICIIIVLIIQTVFIIYIYRKTSINLSTAKKILDEAMIIIEPRINQIFTDRDKQSEDFIISWRDQSLKQIESYRDSIITFLENIVV